MGKDLDYYPHRPVSLTLLCFFGLLTFSEFAIYCIICKFIYDHDKSMRY